MKSSIVFFFVVSFLIACTSKHKNFTKYNDADLLFQYIDDSLKNKIIQEEYIFATFRSEVVCSNCIGNITLTELLDTIEIQYQQTPVFIITDDFSFDENEDSVLMLKKVNPLLINIFYEDGKTLERYGLHGNYPSIFHIKNGDLIEAMRYLKKGF